MFPAFVCDSGIPNYWLTTKWTIQLPIGNRDTTAPWMRNYFTVHAVCETLLFSHDTQNSCVNVELIFRSIGGLSTGLPYVNFISSIELAKDFLIAIYSWVVR